MNFLAIGGALALNAQSGEAPIPYGLPVADLAGGMLAAIAILGALIGHQHTGTGLYLDVSLLDAVVSWMTPLASAAFFHGVEVAAGSLPLLGSLPCYNIYQTADGKYLGIAALEPGFWSEFCRSIDRLDLLTRQFDRSIGHEIAAILRQRKQVEWLALFAEAGGCVEPVNSFEEMLTHPQIQARGYLRKDKGNVVGFNTPFVFARRETVPAPMLGKHTRSILSEIGMIMKQSMNW